jgi:hypothetical protein
MSKQVSKKSYNATKQWLIWMAAHRLYVGKYLSGFFQTIVFEWGSIVALVIGLVLSMNNDSWGEMSHMLLILVPLPLLVIDFIWIIVDYVHLKDGKFTDGEGKIIKPTVG